MFVLPRRIDIVKTLETAGKETYTRSTSDLGVYDIALLD